MLILDHVIQGNLTCQSFDSVSQFSNELLCPIQTVANNSFAILSASLSFDAINAACLQFIQQYPTQSALILLLPFAANIGILCCALRQDRMNGYRRDITSDTTIRIISFVAIFALVTWQTQKWTGQGTSFKVHLSDTSIIEVGINSIFEFGFALIVASLASSVLSGPPTQKRLAFH